MKTTKCVLTLLLLLTAITTFAQTATITVTDTGKTIINKNIYGQFAEHLGRSIYDGFYHNGKIRMDIVDALKEIKVPNLRWPGGCFADQYHWRDGIGETMNRPKTVNNTWGMVIEDNSFGTNEFLKLCDLIGCEPYIAGNVGSGTPHEMKEWLEYLNFDGNSTLADLRKSNGHPAPYHVSLWGVGNESWGCGGNMTAEYYANLYKQYAAFCPNYPGSSLKKIASGANGDDPHWTEALMKNIPANEMYGISLHYYTIPTSNWDKKGSATNFSEAEYANTLKNAIRMEEIIDRHEAIMDKYDPQKKVALMVDEWGVWADAEPGTNAAFLYQQSSLRDALVAATTLNIFNNHADRVKGANLAQAVNVIQSLILTKGDQMLLTPTYYVFELYKIHQNAKLLNINIESPLYIIGKDTLKAVNASASKDENGIIHLSLVNLDPNHSVTVTTRLDEFKGKKTVAQILTSAKLTDINTFENPTLLHLNPFNAVKIKDDILTTTLPAKSIVVITIQ